MPKYLLLNADTEFPQDWRVPQRVDSEVLRSDLRKAMTDGSIITVPIVLGSNASLHASELLVNGAKLSSAAIIEIPDDFPDRPPRHLRVVGDRHPGRNGG